MRAFTILSAFVAVAVSSVLATSGTSPAALIARQDTTVPEVPAECQASCTNLQKITSCGADLKCMCTTEMGQGIVDCGTCGIKYHSSDPNITEYKAQFQASVNSFSNSCTQAGYPIGPFDVLGSTSSSPSSSVAGTTAAGTGTAASSSPTSTSAANGATTMRVGGTFVGLGAVVMALVL